MLRPSIVLAVLLFAFAASVSAESKIEFDGDTYTEAVAITEGKVRRTEYLRSGETLSAWTQMISVQIHPDATSVSDVMNPYAEARQELYAAEPLIYKKEDGEHAEDMIFEFLLLAPDKSFAEFVLVRAFFDPDEPVTLYVMSKRVSLADEVAAEAELGKLGAERQDWFRALAALSVDAGE